MGLLDDAIREHLELKRRRGADPDEVARQEDEALGAPQRGEFAVAEADEEPVTDADATAAYAAGAEPDAGRADREPEDEGWLDDEERDPLDPAPAEPAVDAEEPPRPGGEDVLEETPEFLEETPEHDRLWFEQKPPRDFDFDS
jgi:hypothetical protein